MCCQHHRFIREFLRALVAVKLGIGIRKVDLNALDAAYSIAFPHSTPLNVNKKRRQALHRESNDEEDDEDPPGVTGDRHLSNNN